MAGPPSPSSRMLNQVAPLPFCPLSVWTAWLIPLLGALVLGLMYRYCVMDGRSS